MPTQITTGAARIVWGNPLVAKPKTDDNKRPILDPQTGQPVMQWAFGIAIPKAEFGAIWQAMSTEAATVYPQGVPQTFAWKFKDGDGLDDQGKPYNTREGYAGNIILSVSTESFAPRVVRLNGGAYSDMVDGVKTGDYVRVALTLKAHSGKANVRGSKPGLYINPQMVEFLGYGEAIQNGPDAMQVFGGQQVALPPGASAVPTAPTGAMPMMPGNPGPAFPTMPGSAGNPQQYQPGTYAAPVSAAVPQAPNPAAYQHQGPTAYPSSAPGMPGQPPAPPHHAFVQNAAPGLPPGMPGNPPLPGR